MSDQISVLTSAELMELVEDREPFLPFIKNMFFPNEKLFDSGEIAFDKIVKGMKLAPFVSPVVAGKANRKKGGELKSFAPAYVKPKDIIDPDKLFKRMAGEPLGGPWSPQQRHDVQAVDLMNEQDLSITRREEWMAVEAVKFGKVLVVGEDYPASEIDYGRNDANTAVLAGADKWDVLTKDSTKPEEDLVAWFALAKMPVNVMVMNSVTYAVFIQFDCIKAVTDTKYRGNESALRTGAQSFEVAQLNGYYNHVEVWVYDGEYEDENGDMVKYFADGEIVFGNKAHNGYFCYGAIQDPKAGYVATARYPKNWTQDDPAAEFIMTQAAPLPVDKNPNRIVYRKVF